MSINATGNVNRLQGIQFQPTNNRVAASDGPAEISDTAEISGACPSGSKKGFKAIAGTALLAGLSIAGGLSTPVFAATTAPQVQMVQTNTADSARQSNVNPNGLSDQQAAQILGSMPGLKDPSFGGGFSRFFGGKFSGSDAVKLLDQGKAVQVTKAGSNQTESLTSKDQLAEDAMMRGLYPNSGVSDGIIHAFQAVEHHGGFGANGQGLSGWQALDHLRHGQGVSANVGGQWVAVNSPAQVQELNALEGNGQDNPLNPTTSNLIKQMAERTQGEGLYQNGNKLNAYQYLQAAEGNQGGVSYNFTGGPYNEPLSVPVAHFGDLAQASQIAANQHAADKVRPSMVFFTGQMGQLTKQMNTGVQADLQSAQAQIAGGKSDVTNYTAAAQRESQAIPAAQAAVERAQAGLNNTMPRYNAASQALSGARGNLDAANAVDASARNNEASTLQANNDAQARVNDAKQHIAHAQNILDNQAPADPDAAPANQAPPDPDAAPANGQAPADPDSNSPGQIMAAAQAEKAQGEANLAAAQQDVDATYSAWQGAHAARLNADQNLAYAQGGYDNAGAEYQQADAIRGQAASILQAAQSDLSGHENALASDNQAVANGHANIQAGQQALATAQQLQAASAKYLAQLGQVKSMASLDSQRQSLQDTAKALAGSAVDSGLQQSLSKQQTLFGDMGKPLPPAGFQQGTVVISEQ